MSNIGIFVGNLSYPRYLIEIAGTINLGLGMYQRMFQEPIKPCPPSKVKLGNKQLGINVRQVRTQSCEY
jgi:hypothetical protein